MKAVIPFRQHISLLFQQRLLLATLLAIVAVLATLLTTFASTQISLSFETQGLDLDTGTIFGDETTHDLFNTYPQVDIKIAYNADSTPHAVIIPNEAASVAVISLIGTAYTDVTADDLAELSFDIGSQYQSLTSADTLIIQTASGTHYKLGNPVEDSYGVSFAYEELGTTPNLIWPFIPDTTKNNSQLIDETANGFAKSSDSSTSIFSIQSVVLSLLMAVLIVLGGRHLVAPKSQKHSTAWRTAPALLLSLPLVLMLFGSTQAAPSVINEEQKLLPIPDSDDAEGDQSGYRVAIDGNTAVVGAYRDAAPGTRSGSASIYTFDGTNWVYQTELTASDGNAYDAFSSDVAISGNTAIIGAFGNDDLGSTSGSAYIFAYDGSSWSEQALLLASDGDANDQFGHSVDIDGNTAVVGAFRDDGSVNGNVARDSGAAYIFTYDGTNWVEQAKLTTSDPMTNGFFGQSVTIDGNTVAIGANGEGENGVATFAGTTYVFTFDGTNWTETAKLTASDGDAYDHFGYSVDIEGHNVLIGAQGDDDLGDSSGAAYIFTFDGTNWVEQSKLAASDIDTRDLFGASVDIEGNTAVISAYYKDNIINGNPVSYSGAAYVFAFDGNSWSEQGKLVASDFAYGDYFGYDVALSGDTVLVGVPNDDDAGTSSGSSYVYTRNNNSWSEQTKILPMPDEANYEQFGYAVDIDGDTAVVGAYRDDNFVRDAGAAYIYRFDGTSWNLHTKLFASDRAANDHFGKAVAIDGNTVVIGARGDSDFGRYTGSAYVFTFDGTNWTETAKLLASDAAADDGFGSSVDISGNKIIVDGRGNDDFGSYSGSAYIFTFDGTNWTEEAKLLASDGVAGHFFGYTVSIDGNTAMIGAPRDSAQGLRRGAAYIFTYDGSNWVETTKLMAASGTDGEQLGYSVSLHGNTAVAGTQSQSPYIFTHDGTNWAETTKLPQGRGSLAASENIILVRDYYMVHAYVRTGADWVRSSELIPTDFNSRAYFGWGMGVSGDTAIIGAFYDVDVLGSSGSAYLFHINVPPVVTADQAIITANEGDLAINTGSVSDFNGDTVSLSTNLGNVTNNGDGTWNWSLATTDDLIQTITITADDGAGGTTETSFDLTVNNVAPTVNSITVPTAPVNINEQSAYSIDVTFSDPAGANDEPYTCDFDLDNDGVNDISAIGITGTSCNTTFNYAEPGIYTIQVTVTDKDGGSSNATSNMLIIYNPEGEFVTGGGWISVEAGSCQDASICDPTASGKVNFGLNAQYIQGNAIPTGNAEVNFSEAGLNFHSTSYEWLVINQAGANAQFNGEGTINGNNDSHGNPYKFTVQVQDDDNSDTFHIRIWSELADGTEIDIFDNGSSQEIGGGNIQVH